MGWLGRKHKSGKPAAQGNDKIAKGLARLLSKVQHRWAVWMTRQSAKLSPQAKGIAFFLYGTLMTATCIFIIISSLSGKPGAVNVPAERKQSKVLLQRPVPQRAGIPMEVYERITDFNSLVDSLGRSVEGIRIKDSLLRTRPGLLDSIRMVEQLYRNQ